MTSREVQSRLTKYHDVLSGPVWRVCGRIVPGIGLFGERMSDYMRMFYGRHALTIREARTFVFSALRAALEHVHGARA